MAFPWWIATLIETIVLFVAVRHVYRFQPPMLPFEHSRQDVGTSGGSGSVVYGKAKRS